MTTRRGFLGLIAAVPIAAPAAAKEVLAAPAKLETLKLSVDTSGLTAALGDVRAGWLVGEVPSEQTIPNEALRRLMREPMPWDEPADMPDFSITTYLLGTSAPNRLYGAKINSDGDAV